MDLEMQDCKKMNQNKVIIIMTILVSIFLNHSNRDYGVNVSISDIFIIVTMFLLIVKQKFVIPTYHSMFFGILSISLLLTSNIYTPIRFNIPLNQINIVKDYIKLLASFLFFLLGYNISRLNIMKVNIKWYSIAAMIISFTGLLMKIIGANHLNSLMYFSGSRFRGLMIDPNYYSVIQCTALVYFLRDTNSSIFKKILLYLMTFIFIAMSGSKTGMITLISYSILMMLEYLVLRKSTYKSIIILLISIILLILVIPLLTMVVNVFMNKITELFPIFTRVRLLFQDFNSSIVQGGSGRNITWETAIGIIKSSPLIGIGIGSYITISDTIFGSGSVAHNTYLQIFAEWGGIMAIIFFGHIFLIITKTIANAKDYKYDSVLFITRDIIVILLIGSLAISLNNARMFWMFLGGLVYYINK